MTKQTYNFGFVILVFFLSSIYIVIFSKSGILERKLLKEQNNQIDIRKQILINTNRKLLEKLQKLDNNQFSNQELLDAAYLPKTGKALFIRGITNNTTKESVRIPRKDNEIQINDHYRIIIIVISFLIVLFYFTRRPQADEFKEFE